MGVAGIILAAGGSTRMGRPKQLLPFAGRSLLRHTAEAVVAAGLRPVVAVLPPNAERLAAELDGLPVRVGENVAWERGVGTSIRIGLAAVTDDSAVQAVVFVPCDLPFLTPDILAGLIREYRSGRAVVACRYGDTVGVPALLDRMHFPALAALPDGEGAKRLIAHTGPALGVVDFPAGAVDVDTPADYNRLVGTDPPPFTD